MVPVSNREKEKNNFTPELITNSAILEAANNKQPGSNIDAIRNLQEQLKTLMSKIEKLERKVTMVEHDKSQDIVLFIVIAIFILFVLDNIFRKS